MKSTYFLQPPPPPPPQHHPRSAVHSPGSLRDVADIGRLAGNVSFEIGKLLQVSGVLAASSCSDVSYYEEFPVSVFRKVCVVGCSAQNSDGGIIIKHFHFYLDSHYRSVVEINCLSVAREMLNFTKLLRQDLR